MDTRLPKTARAALFEGPGRPFSICELPLDPPEPGGALVRLSLATVCGSDVHSWTGRRPSPTPGILGHEMVGVVAAVGDGEYPAFRGEALSVGDRITWSEYIACGQCDRCLGLELPQKCRRLRKYGHESLAEPPGLLGGFAQYCHLLPGTTVLRLPQSVAD